MNDTYAFRLPLNDLSVKKNRTFKALGIAITMESVAVAALIAWLSIQTNLTKIIPLPIQIEEIKEVEQIKPEDPPKPIPPPPPPPKPIPVQAKIKEISPPIMEPRPVLASPQPVEPLPVAVTRAPSDIPAEPVVVSKPPSPAPSPAPVPVKITPPPPPPPPQASGPINPSEEYLAKVKSAVQNAFVYPPAALTLDFYGKTRVAFSLKDAVADNVKVTVPSGMSLVDNAAIRAVTNASFPNPTEDQKGKKLNFEIWVEFRGRH
jgi:outer membrane biosynthesis protein TonB